MDGYVGRVKLSGPISAGGSGDALGDGTKANSFSGFGYERTAETQFTSDMLPGDILGAHIYSPTTNVFEFIKGPIFADFILADEVNRTPPRTQSALLEVMEEKQITSEGKQFKLKDDFFVIATQNPQDFEGTFPLPEAQLDRFLFKLKTNHSELKTEVNILDQIIKGELPPDYNVIKCIEVDWSIVNQEINSVTVDSSILDYIGRILEATRTNPLLIDGSSIRGGIAIVKAARILAIIKSRNFVTPDDIKYLTPITLSHRIKLSADAIVSQISEETVINEILTKVPFPK
jgi:MoxR-like ATPase